MEYQVWEKLVFNYLDELIEKQNKPTERKQIGFKTKKKLSGKNT